MRYFFNTYTTVKEYHNNKYWIDNRIVKDISVNADSLQEAIEKYKETVEKESHIFISKNAIKKKENIYRGNKQVGYIFTGKTDIKNKMVYLDLCVEIYISVFA